MKADIQLKLKQDFDDDGFYQVIGDINHWDAQMKGLLDDHLLRAVVYLASGDRARFLELKNQAKLQRDEVIRSAEYEDDVRCRELSRQFGNESL